MMQRLRKGAASFDAILDVNLRAFTTSDSADTVDKRFAGRPRANKEIR